MIELQERDRRILNHCYEQRFLLAEHVMSHHYRDRHRSEAYRRLSELTAAGYLRRVRPIKGASLSLYKLANKGLWEVRKTYPEPVLPSRVSLNNFQHDSLLTAVRFRLAQLWQAGWTSELMLRQAHGREPAPDTAIGDGLLTFASKKRVAVELELTLKNRERYGRILRNWVNSPLKPMIILYVAGSEPVAATLKRFISEAHLPEKPFGVIELKRLIEDESPRVWTAYREIARFAKKEY